MLNEDQPYETKTNLHAVVLEGDSWQVVSAINKASPLLEQL
jgi:hypothetical protein